MMTIEEEERRRRILICTQFALAGEVPSNLRAIESEVM